MKRYCAAALALVLGCTMFTGCRRRDPMPSATMPATQPATHAATLPVTEPTHVPTENSTRPTTEPTEDNTTQPNTKALLPEDGMR